MPNEITQMIVRQLPVEDLKNVACICSSVHEATADILRHHQALMREYHCLNIDVMWVRPQHWEDFGWDIVRSGPIISLCTILENFNLGHYVRKIVYTPDNSEKSFGLSTHDERKKIISHGGALKTAQNVGVLQTYLLENRLNDDETQSKLWEPWGSSNPHDQWNEGFIEHLRIDYGLFIRILLPMVPNLTTLEISWNFDPYSPIGKVIRTAAKKATPFLQRLAKVKLLLGVRPHRMDIEAFMAVPSLRWLSIHHLYQFERSVCYPDLVGYCRLTRLELVDCTISDADLCSYLKMFSSLQHVDILMMNPAHIPASQYLRDWAWRNTQAVDVLFTQCGSTLGSLSMLNIGLEERLKSLENFPVLRSLTLQFSSLFSLDDREPRMISQLSPSVQTLHLWNDLTEKESEIRNRMKLLGLAKSERSLSLRCVEVATEYTSFEKLQRWQPCIEEDLAGYDIFFAFLEKEQWPQGDGREPPEPGKLAEQRQWWAENKARLLKSESKTKY